MPGEFPYAELPARLDAILKADARMKGVHVTRELDQPTSFPFVGIRLIRANRTPIHMVAGVVAGRPDWVTIQVVLSCWEASAQSAEDACRLRDRLVSAVVDVLRDNYNLGGLVNIVQATGIEFSEGASEQGVGIYARGDLMLECRVLA